MSIELFNAAKRPADLVDFYIDCSEEFALDTPTDQISSVSWAVEKGDVAIDSSREEGTDMAIARVSGGTKLYSWHSIRATITCASGQIYTPLIRIQMVK